jgi:hypothetical protein
MIYLGKSLIKKDKIVAKISGFLLLLIDNREQTNDKCRQKRVLQ